MIAITQRNRRCLEGAVLAAAMLAAPLTTAGASAQASVKSANQVTLTFWTHTDPPMVAVDTQVVKQFEKTHPNIKIQTSTIPNNVFFTKMLSAMTTGSGPDVFDMNDDYIRGDYIPQRLLAPVDPQAMGYKSLAALERVYAPGTFAAGAGPNGAVYGIPLEVDAAAFAINTKLFKEAGLNPANYPRTWKQVGTMGAQIAKKDHVQGFNFVYLNGWGLLQLEPLMLQTGGSVLNAAGTKVTIGKPATLRALQIWNNLVNVYHAGNPHTATLNSSVPYYDFSVGKQAMTITWPWAMVQTAQEYPKIMKDVKVVPLPQVNPAHPVQFAYGYEWVVSAKAPSPVQKAAWTFVGYLGKAYQQYIAKSGQVQPVKGWQNTAAGKSLPFASAFAKIYNEGPRFFPVGPNWTQISAIAQTAISKVVLDNGSASAALKSAAGQIQPLLKS